MESFFYQHEQWFVGTLSEACDVAKDRGKAFGRKQKVKLLRGYPIQLGRIWVIVDQYGLNVQY